MAAVHETSVRDHPTDEGLFCGRLGIFGEALLDLCVKALRIAFVKRPRDRRLPNVHPYLGKLGE